MDKDLQKRFIMRILQLLIALFWLGIANAQNLVIDSCRVCNKDSTWIISPRTDINGKPCSVIKVFTTNIKGKLDFKGNIVGDIVKGESAYTIYVLDKTKRLKVYHSDYIPETIDFTGYEDSRSGLECNKVYYVFISGPNETRQASVPVPEGSRVLSFFSDMQLQSLIVDGIEWKILNGNSSKRLIPYGNHSYEAISVDGTHLKGEVNLLPSIGSKIIKLNFK